jgi:hypothetical protein
MATAAGLERVGHHRWQCDPELSFEGKSIKAAI